MIGIEAVRAPNPGPFTGPGTNSYVISSDGEALVLDPGPVIPAHLRSIEVALTGLSAVGVLVTHTHPDHAPAANGLGAKLDVPVAGFAAGSGFIPTTLLGDGDRVGFGSQDLIAVHTPGHTADHLCYRWGDLLFTGDHIMGGSTVIIEDAAAYMASLEKVALLDPSRLYPGHGPELTDAGSVIAEYIRHRIEREEQIVAAVAAGATTVGAIVDVVYAGLDPMLRMAATMQVHTQLIKLSREGRLLLHEGGARGETVVEVAERRRE